MGGPVQKRIFRRTIMLTCLHLSDLHFKADQGYEQNLIAAALVAAVARYTSEGRAPDAIFVTGDIADSGKEPEYRRSSLFFDNLLAAARLTKRRLFIVPGNHDVDRQKGKGLQRTLASEAESVEFFGPDHPHQHFAKFDAFRDWYDDYFFGIRRWPRDSTCQEPELLDFRDADIGVLAINSSLFSSDDSDNGSLWIGRRSLESRISSLGSLRARFLITLVHHPLEWLHHDERSAIKARLYQHSHILLTGHLHEPEAGVIVTPTTQTLHVAAGACYQTRKYSNCASFLELDSDKGRVKLLPIKYEDIPHSVWTTDTSQYPDAPDFQGIFPLRPDTAGVEIAVRTAQAYATPGDASVITEKTRDFTGRRWLDQRLDKFFRENDRGYSVIQGLPGMGKTAYAAHLVTDRNYGHHFNDRLAGITSSRYFLCSLASQMIRKHHLPLHDPTEKDCEDGVYLRRLLDTLAGQLKTENAVEVIVVDAVDEAEAHPDQANILHLPPALPAGVFFVLTRRELADFPLHVQPPSLTITLEDEAGNTDDIVEFLTAVARRPSLSSQLRDRGIEEKEFVQVLQGKAENNFMYLACVVPLIERGEYTGEFSVELPQGLAGYYEQHWQRLRRLQGDRWASALPIICVLAVTKEPLSVNEIHQYIRRGFPELAGLTRMDVRQLTRLWREFLWESREDGRSHFRIYHGSFQEFLEKKDEIGEEINLRAAHGWIADTLWDAWSAGSSGERPKG
jgi:predicted phosphodiesterase